MQLTDEERAAIAALPPEPAPPLSRLRLEMARKKVAKESRQYERIMAQLKGRVM